MSIHKKKKVLLKKQLIFILSYVRGPDCDQMIAFCHHSCRCNHIFVKVALARPQLFPISTNEIKAERNCVTHLCFMDQLSIRTNNRQRSAVSYSSPEPVSITWRRYNTVLWDSVNIYITFTFIHLADAFIQSDLQYIDMSAVARLWSN